MSTVCLVDYGSGNVHSARKALVRAAEGRHEVIQSGAAEHLLRADRIVLPGVGAFAACAQRLRAQSETHQALMEAAARGTPLLGICVGMQLLADKGLEHGETAGLGLIPGTVVPLDTGGLKSPHMGWNTVGATGAPHPLLPADGDAYFVHSYRFAPQDEADIAAVCRYGETFPAMVARGTVAGTQFHPEKSQAYGLALLAHFLEWRP